MAEQLYNKHKEELIWPASLTDCFGVAAPPTRLATQDVLHSLVDREEIHVTAPQHASDIANLVRSDSGTQRYFIEEVVLLLDTREVKTKKDR